MPSFALMDTTNPATGEAVPRVSRRCGLWVVNQIVVVVSISLPLSGGVALTYSGEANDPDDPYYCPYDPLTGEQYQRTVTMFLQCAEGQDGALEIRAVQNATNDCAYDASHRCRCCCHCQYNHRRVSNCVDVPLPMWMFCPHTGTRCIGTRIWRVRARQLLAAATS